MVVPSVLQRKRFLCFCLRIKLTKVLYVPRIRQRNSLFRGKANASGPAYFYYLEGSFPAGGEFVEPFSVQDAFEDQIPSPELPTMHESLMIAFERLVISCISDCRLPPSLVDEVDVVSPELFLQGFIKSLDPW